MASIKNQLKSALFDVLTPLKDDSKVRVLERRRNPYVLPPQQPCAYLSFGEETQVGEDMRGMVMEFTAYVTCYAEGPRGREDALDLITQSVEDLIEADPQLGGLANWVKYQGESPFYDPQSEGDVGGVDLAFRVQYRRLNADVSAAY